MTSLIHSLCFLACLFGICLSLTRYEKSCEKARRKGYMIPCTADPYIPVCDSKLDYSTRQCHGRWCWCASPQGSLTKKRYVADRAKSCFQNCACAIAEHKFAGSFGRKCAPNGNYAVNLTMCQQQLFAMTLDEYKGNNMPKCDAEGMFLPKQCNLTVCNCVERQTGLVIGNYTLTVGNETVDMNCECARRKSEEDLVGSNDKYVCLPNGNYMPPCALFKYFHPSYPISCTDQGFYSPLQCRKNNTECYCIDKYTGLQIEKYEYDNSVIRLPSPCNCAQNKVALAKSGRRLTVTCKSDGSYRHCFEAKNEYIKNNKDSANFDPPQCNCMGVYKASQCHLNRCKCTHPNGHEMEHYTWDKGLNITSNCKCALDQYDYIVREDYSVKKKFYCDEVGMYKPNKG